VKKEMTVKKLATKKTSLSMKLSSERLSVAEIQSNRRREAEKANIMKTADRETTAKAAIFNETLQP